LNRSWLKAAADAEALHQRVEVIGRAAVRIL